MAARKSTRPDLSAFLGEFAEARAVIETACKALENDEHGGDVMTLRKGIPMLDRAYDAPDRNREAVMGFVVREALRFADQMAEQCGGRFATEHIVTAYRIGHRMGFLTGGGTMCLVFAVLFLLTN